MKLFYLLTIIALLVAFIRGFEKGKKSGYTIFAFFGLVIALFTFKIFGDLGNDVQLVGMGKPEVLGQGIGSLLAMALSTSIALGIYSFLFMLIKFNKKDLIVELCCIVITTTITFSSIQLTRSLTDASKDYERITISVKQAKAQVFFNYE